MSLHKHKELMLGKEAFLRRVSHLGALYVVVQIVPEGVDEVDGVVSGVGVGVSREQHCWEMISIFIFEI